MVDRSLADACSEFVREQLAVLAEGAMPQLRLPVMFAGHPVRSDAAVDLASLLTTPGLVSGEMMPPLGLASRVREALAHVVADEVKTFWAYRLAELLASMSADDLEPAERDRLVRACAEASGRAALPSGAVNLRFVLARAEAARVRLGCGDQSLLDEAIGACCESLALRAPLLDDTPQQHGRIDLYAIDALLFAEPIADLLGPAWRDATAAAGCIVRTTASRTGAAITWGRSGGPLATVATVQLAAVLLGHDLTDDRAGWQSMGSAALDSLRPWFVDGLIDTPRRARNEHYRGPERWLQTTFDVLGKVANAGSLLGTEIPSMPRGGSNTFPDHDALVELGPRTWVWSARQGSFEFVVPFVGGPTADYLAAPVSPGVFGQSVDSDVALLAPVVMRGDRCYVTRGRPVSVDRVGDAVTAVWKGWRELDTAGHRAPSTGIGGTRTATFVRRGRTIESTEHLTFSDPVDAVILQSADTAVRSTRLEVRIDADLPVEVVSVATGDIEDLRTAWGTTPVLHRGEIRAPGSALRFDWTVSSTPRVAATSRRHWYVDTIHRHLEPRCSSVDDGWTWPELTSTDLLHVHWPERVARRDASAQQRHLDDLARARVEIVLTMHNLVPHERRPGDHEMYQRWTERARAVVHHTEWGRDRALDRYRFPEDCVHVVIPHPHFGELRTPSNEPRADAERRLGLRPCAMRLGVIGSDRPGSALDEVVEAVVASGRDDVQLLLFHGQREEVPDDPRFVVLPNEFVTRASFDRRLAVLDAIVLTHRGDEILGTGVLAEAIGSRIPVLCEPWGYAREVLGEAVELFGSDVDERANTLRMLDAARLEQLRRQLEPLRDRDDPARIAGLHASLFEQVLAS